MAPDERALPPTGRGLCLVAGCHAKKAMGQEWAGSAARASPKKISGGFLNVLA